MPDAAIVADMIAPDRDEICLENVRLELKMKLKLRAESVGVIVLDGLRDRKLAVIQKKVSRHPG